MGAFINTISSERFIILRNRFRQKKISRMKFFFSHSKIGLSVFRNWSDEKGGGSKTFFPPPPSITYGRIYFSIFLYAYATMEKVAKQLEFNVFQDLEDLELLNKNHTTSVDIEIEM